MRTHSLYSQNESINIAYFDKFDKSAIKQAIVNHLTKHPTDTVEHCKEYSKADIKRFYGSEIINLYEVNPKNNKPSLVIYKGTKQYFKTLTA